MQTTPAVEKLPPQFPSKSSLSSPTSLAVIFLSQWYCHITYQLLLACSPLGLTSSFAPFGCSGRGTPFRLLLRCVLQQGDSPIHVPNFSWWYHLHMETPPLLSLSHIPSPPSHPHSPLRGLPDHVEPGVAGKREPEGEKMRMTIDCHTTWSTGLHEGVGIGIQNLTNWKGVAPSRSHKHFCPPDYCHSYCKVQYCLKFILGSLFSLGSVHTCMSVPSTHVPRCPCLFSSHIGSSLIAVASTLWHCHAPLQILMQLYLRPPWKWGKSGETASWAGLGIPRTINPSGGSPALESQTSVWRSRARREGSWNPIKGGLFPPLLRNRCCQFCPPPHTLLPAVQIMWRLSKG